MEQAVDPKLMSIDIPSYREAWEMVLSQLRMEMSRVNYETWVQPLQPLNFKEGVYRIGAYNAYARDWVESHLRSRIMRLLEGILHQQVTVQFTLLNSTYTESAPVQRTETVEKGTDTGGVGETPLKEKKKRSSQGAKAQVLGAEPVEDGSPRKIQLQRAYGTERARVIQPERGMFLTMYFFNQWLPLLGHSAMTTIMAARSLCYWNPMTGELRNVVETDMAELARRASVSVRTVKDVLNNDLVKNFFLRYKVRRVMTPNGVRTAGIVLMVRMDDPLTPEDQTAHNLPEESHWYTVDFEDESEG